MDDEQYIDIEDGLSVGAMIIANKHEIFTEEEIDNINKIPELDERVDIIENEIEDLKQSGGSSHVDLSDYATKNELNSHTSNTTYHITSAERSSWNNKSNFDGDYNSLINKPTIPTKVSELTNDSNFLTSIPSEYVTETELSSKGYLTQHQSLEGLATEEYVKNKITEVKLEVEDIDLSGYAVKSDLEKKVDKVEGKSLISDSEIVRLATVKNYDDTEIRNTLNNKANTSELHSHTNKSVLDNITSSKVNEWNNKSTFDGNYNNLTNKPTIPTNVSDLTNDSGYLTTHQDISGKVDKIDGKGLSTNDYTTAEKNKLSGLTNYTHPTSHSATMITEDSTHRFVTDSEKSSWNNKSNLALGTTSTTAFRGDYGNTAYTHSQFAHAPSNAQKNSDITKSEIEAKLVGDVTSHTHSQYLTEHQSLSNYALKSEIPIVPTKTSQLTNDSNYITSIPSEYITETELNTALEQFNPNSLQQVPLYANSIEECTDTTKCYVLPDGFIYAYKETTVEIEPPDPEDPVVVPTSKNLVDTATYYLNARYNSSNTLKQTNAETGFVAFDYIDIKKGDILRFKSTTRGYHNLGGSLLLWGNYPRLRFFNANNQLVASGNTDATPIKNFFKLVDEGDNTTAIYVGYKADGTLYDDADQIAKTRFTIQPVGDLAGDMVTATEADMQTVKITINTPMSELDSVLPPEGNTQVVWKWSNTGHAFVPNENYDNLIADMKNITDEHSKDIVYLKAIVNSEDSTSGLSDSEKIARIKNWDMPIYENAPVFLLEENKPGWATSNLTNDKLIEMYDTLMNNNSHYITKEDLGFASDGTTPLYAYHFREPEPHQNGKKGSEKKPVILICSGIHPTERAGEWSMYYALEEITNNLDLDDLRRNVHFIIMPLINPTAVKDSTWGVRNPDGIQTHYQFEVDFNKGNASHGERNYGGEQPLTIPESIAFDNLMKTYKNDLAIVMSCHNCDVDTQRGTDFIWCSCPTNFATNLGYRLADKMSKAWHKKHGTAFEEGVRWANAYALQKASEGSSIFNPTYIKERPEWDWRVGQAGLSGSGGTEYKQALKYGVQGINVEVCSRNMVMDKDWSKTWTSNVMTWGCETYVNFFRIFMAVYDYKDKEQYYKK